MSPRWRYIPLWRVVVALQRGTLEWWNDPKRVTTVLRARSGAIYDFKRSRLGWFLRRRQHDELFQS